MLSARDGTEVGGCHMSHFSNVLLCTLHMLHQLVLTTAIQKMRKQSPSLEIYIGPYGLTLSFGWRVLS